MILRRLLPKLSIAKSSMLLLWLACWLLCAPAIVAQPPANNPGLPERVPSALENGVVKPDAFYLRDSGGNYIFVPNLRYEEFERLIRSQKPLLDPQLPTHQFIQWDIAGDVQGDVCKWDVTVAVRLSSAVTGAVAIPIGLADWHLSATPQFEGTGEHLLELMSPQAGYQWWIKGEANSEHRLTLRLTSRVTQTVDRLSIKTSLPAAPIRVKLIVDGSDLQPEIEGQSGVAISSKSISENRSELAYETSGGNQNLQWRRTGERVRVFAVECQSITRVNVAEVGSPWQCRTAFTIQSAGAPPADFLLTLPPGAQWQPSSAGEAVSYALEAVATEATSATNANDVMVRCRLGELRRGVPIEIGIDWTWQPQVSEDASQVTFGAPQIQTVDRHEGYIELTYPTNYRLITVANSNTFPVPYDSTSSGSDANSVRYRFERHPASLRLSLRPEFAETRLRPTYVVEVFRNRLQLRGLLDISFAQGQPSSILFAPGNWSISDAEQTTTGSAISLQPEGEGRIRLQPSVSGTLAADSTRSSIWQVEGLRELADDRSLALKIDLPSLINEIPGVQDTRFDFGSGVIVLVPSDNVLLQTNEVETTGLIADSEIPIAALELIPADRRRRAVAYRFQSSTSAPSWAGSRELLPQQVTAEADTKFDISSQLASVTQRWKLRVANEPLAVLQMVVNREALDRSSIIATIDGNAMSLQEVQPSPDQRVVIGEGEALVEFMQSGDLIGELQIAVDMKFPIEVGSGGDFTKSLSLSSLILPEKSGYLKAILSIQHSPDLELSTVKATTRSRAEWKEIDLTSTNSETPSQTDFFLNGLQVTGKRLDRMKANSVRVLRTWLQTAFNTAQRRDRLAFLVNTSERRVSVRIPAESLTSLYDVLIDGQRGIYSIDSEGSRVVIELPDSSEKATRCIELWSEAGRSVTGEAVGISLASMENTIGNPPFIWELVLPTSEHLVLPPQNMTPEWQWSWGGLGWNRQSGTNQSELERWVGASVQSPLPARLNRYVMSGFGVPQEMTFTIMPKPWIWLPVGALIIVLTLIWSTVRWLRHPVCVASFFVAVATLGVYFPDAAMMFAQLIVLASVLALVMLISQWAIGRRVKRRSVFTSYPPSGSQSLGGGSGIAPRLEKSNNPAAGTPSSPSGTATVANPGMVES